MEKSIYIGSAVMKRTVFFLACFLLSFFTVGFSEPIVVQAAAGFVCSGAITGSGAASFTFSIPFLGNVSVGAADGLSVTHSAGAPAGFSLTGGFASNSWNNYSHTPILDTVTISGSGNWCISYNATLIVSSRGGSTLGPLYSDGRLNNDDGAETSAIYCMGDGSVRVLVPGSPLWNIAFTASPAEIN